MQRAKFHFNYDVNNQTTLFRFMTAEVDQDQGLLALFKFFSTRLLNTAAGIFHDHDDEQKTVDEETGFLVGKLVQKNYTVCSYLTEPILQELQEIKTSTGFTLKDGLRRGIREKDKIGILAGDEESYMSYHSVFDPLIKDIHGISADHLHSSNLDPDALGEVEFDKHRVLSCRIRVLRSLKGFPFSWFCSRDERVSIETILASALERLKGELIGFHLLVLPKYKHSLSSNPMCAWNAAVNFLTTLLRNTQVAFLNLRSL